MPKSIFIATEGEYSDYHIIGVFSTRELAEKSGCAYEEWRIDSGRIEHESGLKPFEVIISKNGDIIKVVSLEFSGIDPIDEDTFNDFMGETPPYNLSTYMWAKDEKHAIKIASERRAKYIALDKWAINQRYRSPVIDWKLRHGSKTV